MGFAVVVHLMAGIPGRFSPEVQAYAATALDTNPARNACDSPSHKRLDGDDVCSLGAPDAPLSFALIGDSFGDAVAPGVDQAAKDAGRRGLVLTHSGCFPLAGVQQTDNISCNGVMNATLGLMERHPEIKDVIIVARWTSAFLGTRFGQFEQSGWFLKDDETRQLGYDENRNVFERGMVRTLHALDGRNITIFAYIPEQRYDVPRAMAMHSAFGRPQQVDLLRSDHEKRQLEMRGAFKKLTQASPTPFRVIDVGASLCNAQSCGVIRDGVVLYADDNHLSRSGGIALKSIWGKAFEPVAGGVR